MAGTEVTTGLRAVPLALLVALEAWVVIDLLSVDNVRWAAVFGVVWIANLAFLAVAAVSRWRFARWAGLVGLGGAYVGMHAFVLGVQLLPALVFVSLMIAQVELRILAERFAPLFAASLNRSERSRIGGTLTRAVLRLTIALILAIVVPLLASDLSAAGFVPVTSVPSALLLSAALIGVIVLLALLPSLEGRTS